MERRLAALEKELRQTRRTTLASVLLAIAASAVAFFCLWYVAVLAPECAASRGVQLQRDDVLQTERSPEDGKETFVFAAEGLGPCQQQPDQALCRDSVESLCQYGCRVKAIKTGKPVAVAESFCRSICARRLRRAADDTTPVSPTAPGFDRPVVHLIGKVKTLQKDPFPIHSLTFTPNGTNHAIRPRGVGQGDGDENATLIIRTPGFYHVYGQITFNDHRREGYTLRLTVNRRPVAIAHHSNAPIINNDGAAKRQDHGFTRKVDQNGLPHGDPLPDLPPFQQNNFEVPLSVSRVLRLKTGDRLQLKGLSPGSHHGHVLLKRPSKSVHFFGLYML